MINLVHDFKIPFLDIEITIVITLSSKKDDILCLNIRLYTLSVYGTKHACSMEGQGHLLVIW